MIFRLAIICVVGYFTYNYLTTTPTAKIQADIKAGVETTQKLVNEAAPQVLGAIDKTVEAAQAAKHDLQQDALNSK